jgi:DNA gyrase subunit A
VTLISLDEGSVLSGLQRIVENDANVPDSAEAPDAADAAGSEPADGTA